MKKSLYIAGKMRGLPYYNFPAFDKARDRLVALGFEVFSPADMDREAGFDPFKFDEHLIALANDGGPSCWDDTPPSFDLAAAIKRDNEAIAKADGVFVLHEGFADSEGATAEVELAMKLTKIVVYDTMTDAQILKAMGADLFPQPPEAAITVETADPLPIPVETRYTDPATGGQKGEKLARFDLLPPDILWELAEHYGKGARKYADRNMEKGYPWSKSYAACQRHLNAFWNGEDVDAETGSLHLISAAWHCITMAWFYRHGAGEDNRPNAKGESK